MTSTSVWFVEVEREGGYWLGPETLRTLGTDPLAEPPPVLRLSWADREIPHLPVRTGDGWGVYFFAPDRSTRYTRRTAFRLDMGRAGEAMAAGDAPPARHIPVVAALASARWGEDHRYLPQAVTEIPWFWERILAPGAVTHTVTLPSALPGPITTTLHVWSHTASSAQPDHALRLTWDGRSVGEWEWDGQGMHHLVASWEEERAAGEHTLAVETPALPGVEVAMVWLDGWDVDYRRRVDAGGSAWQAEAEALRIEGAGPGVRVLDVTDPFATQDLGPVPSGGVVGTVPGHRYWVGTPEKSPEPVLVRGARQVNLAALEGVAYLALAPSELHAPLEPLLEHRRGQGLQAALVEPQAVYDTFGTGRPDPQAARELLQRLPELRYLLLVGDGAAEPWGYDGDLGALRVVVPLTRTAVLGETPVDGMLGTDREGSPVVAVGRFPAASADEVAAMVRKTIRWEGEGSVPSTLLLSDDGADFIAVMDEVAALFPPGAAVERLDAGEEQARARTLDALKRGPTWLNYVGHGSMTVLCREGILTLEDGEAWREPALVVAWTCLAAHFIHPTQDSMAEFWLREPRGGAVAFLGPVGETTVEEQAPFAMAFSEAMLGGERLGDAWLAALQEGDSSDVARSYLLLGDPALELYGE